MPCTELSLPQTIRLRYLVARLWDSSGAVTNNLVPQAIAETAALAKYPNMSVKLSSVPVLSTESYPFRDVIPHIHRLFDAHGPRGCHWGTDVTNSLARATYGQRVTQFTEETDFPLGGGQGLDHGPRDPGAAQVGLSTFSSAAELSRRVRHNGGGAVKLLTEGGDQNESHE
jgi:hypothetical protein